MAAAAITTNLSDVQPAESPEARAQSHLRRWGMESSGERGKALTEMLLEFAATTARPTERGAVDALDKWRIKDGYVPAYMAGWNAMLDKAKEVFAENANCPAALALSPQPGREKYRHLKRGTVYEVIGRASLQNASEQMLHDHHQFVIYRSDDGKLWAREEGEFHDGRFEAAK